MPDLVRIAFLAVAVALAACGPRSGPPAPVSHGGDSRPALSRAEAASGMVEVQPGDTLYSVARRTGTPVRALIEANRLQAPYRIQAGQRLQIPAAAVAQNRTVAPPPATAAAPPIAPSVAPGVVAVPRGSVESAPAAAPPPAAAPAAAPTGNPETATGGAGAVPAAVMPPPAAPGGEATAPVSQAPAVGSRPGAGIPAAASPAPAASATPAPEPGAGAPASAAVDTPPARAGRFLWPLRGNVVSTFGQKPGGLQNDGINIAAPLGTPVRAAENGVVVYAGNELKGFGNLLLLRHADGWMSAYAHLDEITIARGASVGRGQVIGKVGQTGSVSTPQLHFELRRGGRAVDPRGQLAPLQTAAAD